VDRGAWPGVMRLRGEVTGLLYFGLSKRDHVVAEQHDSAARGGVAISLAS